MPITPEEYRAFYGFVCATDGSYERECGRFLHHAAEFLCPNTPERVVNVRFEGRTHYGDSDLVIVADWRNGRRGNADRYAVIWEIKAPQCRLMEADDNRVRYRPTRDLVKAENQLLHYYNEYLGNEAFRRREGILTTDRVKLGGIIIGREGRLSIEGTEVSEELAEQSLEIRSRLLYEKASFSVRTWDEIARVLEPQNGAVVA